MFKMFLNNCKYNLKKIINKIFNNNNKKRKIFKLINNNLTKFI